jgi:nucleotide-binding universal stress UspA family protein
MDERPIRRVLVPLDGSPRARSALPAATTLAKQAGATLELLTVQSTVSDWERDLQALAESAPESEVDTTVVSSGTADEAIADLAAAVTETVICMATRGKSGLQEALLGSTAARVVRRANNPVILLGPRAQTSDPAPAYTEIVACMSGAERAEAMLPVVRSWAHRLGTSIELVHGVAETNDHDRTVAVTKRLDTLATEEAPEHLQATVHVVRGSTPAHGLAEHLEGREHCLAFVVVRRGARMARLLPGGVTAELLQRAPVPIVVLTA